MLEEYLLKLKKASFSYGALDEQMAESVAHDAYLQEGFNEQFAVRAAFCKTKDALKYERVRTNNHIKVGNDDPLHVSLVDERHYIEDTNKSQVQLIKSLMKEVDGTTKSIIKTWLSIEKPTITKVGKELGLHHQKVRRCLDKLKDSYNPEIHGDINEYFTV